MTPAWVAVGLAVLVALLVLARTRAIRKGQLTPRWGPLPVVIDPHARPDVVRILDETGDEVGRIVNIGDEPEGGAR